MADNPHDPPLGLGLASVVLGAVGLLLFLLPVLGIPLGAAGLGFGLIGLVTALLGGRSSLRWSVAGIAVCLVALAADISIALVPQGYLPQPQPRVSQPAADRPYVPPPARPGGPAVRLTGMTPDPTLARSASEGASDFPSLARRASVARQPVESSVL
jgi:hypothetical protein